VNSIAICPTHPTPIQTATIRMLANVVTTSSVSLAVVPLCNAVLGSQIAMVSTALYGGITV
jgi:hypothetical protein